MGGVGIGWLVAALGVGVGFAVWSYARLPVRVPKGWLYSLSTLRALAVAGLFVLLGEPIRSCTVQREVRPKILFLVDHSQSVFWCGALEVEAYRERIQQLTRQLEAAGFQVGLYALDRGIRPIDSLTGRGEASWLLVGIQQALEREPEAQLLVLFSDGVESGEQTAPLPTQVSIWTVAVGPTEPIRDAALEALLMPPSAYEGQPIQLTVQLRGVDRPATLRVSYPGGQKTFPVAPATQRLSVSLPSLPAGLHPIRCFLDLPSDPNPANNTLQEFLAVYVQQPAFVLWAGELTPDIAFLRRALSGWGKVYLIAARKPSGYTASADSLAGLSQAVHVWYNFPARAEDLGWAQRILAQQNFLLTLWGAISMPQEVRAALGLQTEGPLTLYALAGGVSVYLRRWSAAAGAYPVDVGWGAPVGYRYFQGNRLVSVLAGEGWWRLRESARLTAQWDSLVGDLVREGQAVQQSRFAFAPERTRVRPGEAVRWRGWLPPQAQLSVGGRTLPIERNPEGFCQAAWLPESLGTFPYAVEVGGSVVQRGSITVEPFSQELMRLGRDTVRLSYLAQATGGQAWTWETSDSLLVQLRAALPTTTLVSSQRDILPFHEWSVWLILVLALLGAEWLLRRYVGLY